MDGIGVTGVVFHARRKAGRFTWRKQATISEWVLEKGQAREQVPWSSIFLLKMNGIDRM